MNTSSIYYNPEQLLPKEKNIEYREELSNTFAQAKEALLDLKNHRHRIRIAGVTIGIALGNINHLLASELKITKFTQKVDEMGNLSLAMVQSVGYWLAIIFAGIDVIKNFKKEDIAGILAIVFKYVIINGVLYALPWIFDVFQELFQ